MAIELNQCTVANITTQPNHTIINLSHNSSNLILLRVLNYHGVLKEYYLFVFEYAVYSLLITF